MNHPDGSGYLATWQSVPARSAWDRHHAWCAAHGVPLVWIGRATYWKVTVDAAPLPGGRLSPSDRDWLTEVSEAFAAHAPSPAARVKALPVRLTVYGLERSEARRLASMIVDRLHPEAWTPDPAAPPDPPRSLNRARAHGRPGIVDLASERQSRRPPLRVRDRFPGDPWGGDAS